MGSLPREDVHPVSGEVGRRQQRRERAHGGGPAGLPPIMGVHGDNDYIVPVEDSRHFYRRLKELRGGDGGRDVFVELEGAHHAFGLMASPRSFALSDAACAFLNAVVGRKGELGDDGGDGRSGVHLPSKL